MIGAGDISVLHFPQVDRAQGKLRPVLVLGKLPGAFDDWLVCMISSQTRHFIPDFDELLSSDDPDFAASGLRVTSLIRVGRVAVVDQSALLGAVGRLSEERLVAILARLAKWFTDLSAALPVSDEAADEP